MTTNLKRGANAGATLFSQGNIVQDHKPKLSYGKGSKTNDIVLQVSDVAVFRSGTFRDSIGFQHTWEEIHIDQMVTNFDYLLRQGVFEDVPVRKGHGSLFGEAMDGLIGWHTGLRAENKTGKDGKEYRILFASFEIFDKEAQEHIEGGHWRNRSSEVGFYLTNAEAEFWPVYQGFAYVDIPAVEFLNSFSKAGNQAPADYTVMTEEEIAVTRPTGNHNQSGSDAAGDSSESPQAPETNSSTDLAPETPPTDDPPANDPAPEADDPPANDPAPEAPAAPGGTVEHSMTPATASNSSGTSHHFRVNGQTTSDFGAVQQHIDTLETAQREHTEAFRANFVTALARDNKIPATQVEALTRHAQGLTADQFNTWSASYESVPASPLFSQHGATGGDGSSTPAGESTVDEIETLRGVVEMHSKTMPQEQLEQLPSYKKLQQLEAALAGNQS